MAKRDTLKTGTYKRWAYEWSVDAPPSKKQKKEKAAERQAGKKEIREETKVARRVGKDENS